MKAVLLAVVLAVLSAQGFEHSAGEMCLGAKLAVLHAQEGPQDGPERSTPKGEWCQRERPQMSSKAHACACHDHDCKDDDPSHVSAHTDPHCLNFCTTTQCRCVMNDCP